MYNIYTQVYAVDALSKSKHIVRLCLREFVVTCLVRRLTASYMRPLCPSKDTAKTMQ